MSTGYADLVAMVFVDIYHGSAACRGLTVHTFGNDCLEVSVGIDRGAATWGWAQS